MTKIIWETVLTVPRNDEDGMDGVKFEDGGQAAILYSPVEAEPAEVGGDGCFFVRLQSWDERRIDDPNAIEHQHHKSAGRAMTRIVQKPPQLGQHPLFRSLMGRKIKISIETID